jgi:uncharacterized phage protein (TIGR02218 family)
MDLTQPELTLAEIYEITTQEGAVARFTSHDADIMYDIAAGGYAYFGAFTSTGKIFKVDIPSLQTLVYQAIPIKRSEINYHTDLQVDKVDISMGLVGIKIGEKKYSIPKIIRLGLFRHANVKISLIDYVALDEIKLLFEGWITQGITYNKGICKITVGSLLDKLNEKFPKFIYSEYCNHQLFSSYCGLVKDDYKESSSAGSSSTQVKIYSDIFAFSAHAEGYWSKGEIKMTSGDNEDITRSIFKHGDGYVELLISFPETAIVGETFNAWPGCDKSGQTCDEKFSNYENFLGFESIPQPEVLYSY